MKDVSRNHKVCIVTSVHIPFDTRIFYREAAALRESGYSVYIIAQHKQKEVVDRITILPLPQFRNRFVRMLFGNLRSVMLSLKVRADVYHLHDPELIPAGLLLKCYRKKVIYDHHDDVVKFIMIKEYVPTVFRSMLSFLVELILKFSLKHFDYLIAATNDIKEVLRKCTASENIVSITNYPELQYFEFRQDIQRKKAGFSALYMGLISRDRGACQIIEAMAHMPSEIELVLVGKMETEQLEGELQALDGYDRVKYLGFMDFRQAIEQGSSTDVGLVCLQPAKQHIPAMPNKLFEYMALGLPIVASNFPLWKEIVEGNDCGICVDPTNPNEIAQAVTFLYEHPEVRKRMSENGRRLVSSKYNWEQESKKLLHVYSYLLQDNRCI